jgi:hypothetical protein
MEYMRRVDGSLSELRKREGRGKLLSALIALDFALVMIGLAVVITKALSPQPAPVYDLSRNVLDGMLLVAIWRWRKLAACAYLAIRAAHIAWVSMNLLLQSLRTDSASQGYILAALDPNHLPGGVLWGGLAGASFVLLLWIWALWRKRRLFA